MTSIHMRKKAVSDTGMNHQFHDFMDEDHSSDDSDDDESPETKDQFFEFSNGYGVMRLIRMALVVQIISIVLENPSLEFAALFRIACRGVLYYAIRFYSRPFIDVLYLIQFFYQGIANFFIQQNVPASPDSSNTEITTRSRLLNTNPYGDNEPTSTADLPSEFVADVIDDRTWHSLKHISHLFLGVLFAFMAVAFTLQFWQISDYSNRQEIKDWLLKYISDGWWRRGGLGVALSIAKGCLLMALVLLSMNALATQASIVTIPENRIVGAFAVVFLSVVGIVWLLGYIGIRFTEAAFVRYVSQNVSYTSAIILKRAVKAKLDLGYLLMITIYMPLLYTLLRSVTVITDWNDTLVVPFRRQVNFFVPCYFQAFPPYRQNNLDAATCPVTQYTSDTQPLHSMREHGFYFDANILPCDSLLGITVFTVCVVLLVYLILGYWYILGHKINHVTEEFKSSKFVDILEKLTRIREDEIQSYEDMFHYHTRVYMDLRVELGMQFRAFRDSGYWLFLTLIRTLKGLIRAALRPLKWILTPVRFFLERLVVIWCMNEDTKRSRKLKFAAEKEEATFAAYNSNKPGSSASNNREALSTAESMRMSGGSGSPGRPSSPGGFSTISAADENGNNMAMTMSGRPGSPSSQLSQTIHSRPYSPAGSHLSSNNNNNEEGKESGLFSGEDMNTKTGLSRKTAAISFKKVMAVDFDDDYKKKVDTNLEGEFNISQKFAEYTEKYNPVLLLQHFVVTSFSRFVYYMNRRPTVVWLRVKYTIFMRKAGKYIGRFIFTDKDADDDASLTPSHGLANTSTAALGGASAQWRVERTIKRKFHLLRRLHHHMIAELRNAKTQYVNDHDLLISALDYTVDSAGMFTLVIPYHYHRMYWMYVVMLELTLYALAGATLNFYTDWVSRAYVFLFINNAFQLIVYLGNPYTEMLDRWLDFTGRLLISCVILGTIYCASLEPNLTDSVPTELYEPWDSFNYITNVYQTFGVYQVIDISMVVFFYCYIFFVLYEVGTLGMIDRMIKSFQFGYHDHVLDYLVENLDVRTYGLENIFTGLQLIQQWDDIIRMQRRYALLTWPEVRPASIVSLSAKLFEIKWASLFNLTLRNLRSSLGLTILHTVMFSADGDVARWVIHTNPDLLMVEDSQNDTPITIALKECAYFLLAFGQQNDGALDDGTAYRDDVYNSYYPEVDDLRDEIYNNGEFVTELCISFALTSKDLIVLQEDGFYKEPPPKAAESPDKQTQKEKPKLDIYGNRIFTEEEIKEQKAEKKRKQYAKAMAARAQAERASVFSNRFPEDELIDDFEVGQMASWGVISANVPDNNIFMDGSILRRTAKDNQYHFELPEYDLVHGQLVTQDTIALADDLVVKAQVEADIENNLKALQRKSEKQAAMSPNGSPSKRQKNLKNPGKMPKLTESAIQQKLDKDLQYVVRSSRKMHYIDDVEMQIPMNHEFVKKSFDFDRKRRAKRSKRGAGSSGRGGGSEYGDDDGTSSRRDSVADGAESSAWAESRPSTTGSSRTSISGRSDSSMEGLLSRLTRLNSPKTDLQTRIRICKFAEILMSEEMSKSCSKMRWKILEFKKFNKLASATQGKIAQTLAMVCSLNAPPGFVRISDWSLGEQINLFDEAPEEEIPMVVKGIVTLFGVAQKFRDKASAVVQNTIAPPSLGELRGKGRARRSRRSSVRSKSSFGRSGGGAGSSAGKIEDAEKLMTGAAGDNVEDADRIFNDRVVQYLAEALVCSNSRVDLDDSELSYNGRIGWRAIARALRRKHCSFVLPSLYVPMKEIRVMHLILTRNELDCGDAVLIADIFTHQLHLKYVDLSYNRIGARGMSRMCIGIRDHPRIHTFKIDHNIIGPAAGKNLGIWLKKTPSLRVFSASHNRMGEIVRFPTLYTREKILSAVREIFAGVKSNKTLELLDLSYNHLGPDSGDCVPTSINRHPRLHTLNFAGNDLGPQKGTTFLFFIAGFPGGAAWAVKREEFIRSVKQQQTAKLKAQEEGEDGAEGDGGGGGAVTYALDPEKPSVSMADPLGSGVDAPASMLSADSFATSPQQHPLTPGGGLSSRPSPSQPSPSGKLHKASKDPTLSLSQAQEILEAQCIRPASLTSLNVADNQLDAFSGHAVASLIERNKSLTHLDVSGNSLGHQGGMLIGDQIELMYGLKPRDFLKIVLWEIEESKYHGRNAKKRVKIFTTLTSLNMSRNGIGPSVVASLFFSLGHANCTITNLDVSDNPLGYSIQSGGSAVDAGVDIRFGIGQTRSLRFLNMNRSCFKPVELVPMLGGLIHNRSIMRLELQDVQLDEPSCLQLATSLEACVNLRELNLARCHMGANGSMLLANKIPALSDRLRILNLNDNYMGPIAAVFIGEALGRSECTIHTVYLAHNDLIEEGGVFIARSLIGNQSLTDIDLSGNFLTHQVGVYIADAARGLFENGKKIADCPLRRLLLNNNPLIGYKAARTLVKALGNDIVQHLELRNIGAKVGSAKLIANFVRDPVVAWKVLDVRENAFSRVGLNQIFWAMRQNKRMRILRVGENEAGSRFCSDEDALLRHGISVPRFLRTNVVLRELDLSYNTLSTSAGINILDAMIDNHTIKKLSLRGNLIDDHVATILPDLLRCNNVLEELDMGHNRMGYSCAFALAEGLELNRSLKRLIIDYNRFGGAGTATLDTICRSIMMNYTLQVLIMDGNKLGPQWGIRLAETFARNNTLLQVSLRDNRLDIRAGKALLNAYAHAAYMLELALSADEIGVDLWERFKVEFEIKRASTAPGNYYSETTLSENQTKIIASYTTLSHGAHLDDLS